MFYKCVQSLRDWPSFQEFYKHLVSLYESAFSIKFHKTW